MVAKSIIFSRALGSFAFAVFLAQFIGMISFFSCVFSPSFLSLFGCKCASYVIDTSVIGRFWHIFSLGYFAIVVVNMLAMSSTHPWLADSVGYFLIVIFFSHFGYFSHFFDSMTMHNIWKLPTKIFTFFEFFIHNFCCHFCRLSTPSEVLSSVDIQFTWMWLGCRGSFVLLMLIKFLYFLFIFFKWFCFTISICTTFKTMLDLTPFLQKVNLNEIWIHQ